MTSAHSRTRVAALAAALVLAAGSRARAQDAALVLTVTASESQAPMQGAQVKVDGRGVAVTDAQGSARVALSPGAHQVEITAIGRHPQALAANLAAGETQDVEVQLVPEAVPLTAVTATAEAARARSPTLNAFYERAANHANGTIYTREYIDRRKPSLLSDLLLDHTGLQYVYTRGGHRVIRFLRNGDHCPPRYFLNGLPFDVEQGSEDPSLDLAVHIDDVEGVEVYPGLPPIQYGGLGAACGVVLIWLREDGGGFDRTTSPPPAPPAHP